MTALGRGRVKTPKSQQGEELFSLLPFPDRSHSIFSL
jgi:hypothetical protein